MSGQPNLSRAASMTCTTLAGPGTGVPTFSVSPSLSALRQRNSTGSMPSFSASLLICISAMKSACGAPKPRKAAEGMLFVYTPYTSVLTLGMKYGPLDVMVELPSTLFVVYMYAPPSAMISDSPATSLPSLVAPHLARNRMGWRLPCPRMDSLRLQMILTGRFSFQAASPSTICTDISSRPPNAPPMAG